MGVGRARAACPRQGHRFSSSLPIPLLAGEADPVAAATGFQPQEEGERTMAYTRYKGDPYWKRAKVGGNSADGTPYDKGDRVFFYPRSRATYAGNAASRASAEFDELASPAGCTLPPHPHPSSPELPPGYHIRPTPCREK